MPKTPEKCKKFRIENHLPQPIFVELWRKRHEGKKTVMFIRAYLERPISRYHIRRINTKQALGIKLTEPIDFEFTSRLGRDIIGKHCKTDYGYLLSFDFFAKGAN